jgi:hypothetical protein
MTLTLARQNPANLNEDVATLESLDNSGHIRRNRSSRKALRQLPTRTQISLAVGFCRTMFAKSSSFDMTIELRVEA